MHWSRRISIRWRKIISGIQMSFEDIWIPELISNVLISFSFGGGLY